MTNEVYQATVKLLTRQAETVVQEKRPQYTLHNEDVLINFKDVAKQMGISPLQAWYVFFHKHLTAVQTFCRTGEVPTSGESLDSRFVDLRNYLDLGYALYKEYQNENNPTLDLFANNAEHPHGI